MYNLLNFKVFKFLSVLSIFLFPLIAEPSSLILDKIDIVSIQDMQLRKENQTYFMDVVCVVRNSSKYILKLQDCKFDLSFVPEDSQEIRIGATSGDEILLEKKADSPYTDTNVPLVAHIESDIEKFHLNITSSEEMSSLLMEPKPKLNLHIQGNLGVGIKVKQGWVHIQGITIDWTLTP